MPQYRISPLSSRLVDQILGWRYSPPYGIYDLSPQDRKPLLNPDYRYHQVLDSGGSLVGYCCFGEDARVPGGKYQEEEGDVLDLGVGMHPDLVGRGLGADFVRSILAFGRDQYSPRSFRVTVADFNQRSLKTFRKLGFRDRCHFKRQPDGMPFTQLERRVDEGPGRSEH